MRQPPQRQGVASPSLAATEGFIGRIVNVPIYLHPATAKLVCDFAAALAEKLRQAELKHGYSPHWASPDWLDECRRELLCHIAKGDPRDVAAYCAFLWFHGAQTSEPGK